MLQRYLKKMTMRLNDAVWSLRVHPSLFDDRPQFFPGPSRNYHKFVILSHQRAGSSMVIGALATHPQIVAFGELFIPKRIGFNIEGYDNDSAKLLYLRDKYPIEFLERYIFSSYSKDIRAVGFKLFPDQLEKSSFQCVWEWLIQNKDIKVILLTRHNLLATYTSLLIAQKTGTWGIMNEAQRTDATITIDYEKCVNAFKKRKEYRKKVLEYFKDHDLIDIPYEDMILDFNNYFKELQQSLGVDIHHLKVGPIKKEVRPLSEVITNYSELRRKLLNTEWEYLFKG